MFNALDTLRATATGLDEIPTWFLRLGAPVFAKPVAQLLNLSISTSIVPVQWKQASICPVPKTGCPREHCDFRAPHHSTVPLSNLPFPKEKMPKLFWGGGTAPPQTPPPLGRGIPLLDPTPVDAFGVSIRVPSALDPPDHISGYGPDLGNGSSDRLRV